MGGMKIAYCINAICYDGGMEMATICKANALAEVEGNEVFIIVTDNKRDFRIHPLSPKVHLIDLHVNYNDDDWKSRWLLLKSYTQKRHLHKQRLAKVLRQLQPDIVVSTGESEKYFLPLIRGHWKTVSELHFSSNYRLFIAHSPLQRCLAHVLNRFNYYYKLWCYDQVVVLTQEDKSRYWHNHPKVAVIPNSITFPIPSVPSSLCEKRFVAAGRLTVQKNFPSLLRAFQLVVAKHPDWTLDIYGEGSQRTALQDQITRSHLNHHAFLRGYTANLREQMLHASGYVLSSSWEGFGLVLIEAMSFGLPVVSYACPCGPRDIIRDGQTGFLVPVNDEATLAARICQLIEDAPLRQRMGAAARADSQKYQMEHILPLWMNLFRSLLAH